MEKEGAMRSTLDECLADRWALRAARERAEEARLKDCLEDAAPDMLAMLKFIHGRGDGTWLSFEAQDDIEALIAKAEGRGE